MLGESLLISMSTCFIFVPFIVISETMQAQTTDTLFRLSRTLHKIAEMDPQWTEGSTRASMLEILLSTVKSRDDAGNRKPPEWLHSWPQPYLL